LSSFLARNSVYVINNWYFSSSYNQGSGQQCCYDENEQLLVGPPGGGTVDLYAPTDWTGFLKHLNHDVLPFFIAA